MAIDRSFTRVLAAWVGIIAILMVVNFNVVRCHAAAPDVTDDPALYPAATDSNHPQTLPDHGSVIGWGSERIDSSVFNALFIAIAAGGDHSLALKTDGSIVGWGLQANAPDGTLMTGLKSSGRQASDLTSGATITDGDWHRIGFTWDGETRTLYVDNVEVAQDTQDNLAGSAGKLLFGASTNFAPSTFWSGLIDDVRIYNRAVQP